MRGGQRYEDILLRHAAPVADPQQKASSWFVPPAEDYDPRLLTSGGDRMHPEVAAWVRNTLFSWLTGQGYRQPERWAHVWVAGSGLTKQWQAGGDLGDLDVLIGVNWPEFFRQNPEHRGTPSERMAMMINQEMHGSLWLDVWYGPNGEFGTPFEVTFFINPGTSDIRDLKPYAAYDVVNEEWTVPPLELPGDWGDRYVSDPWARAISQEIRSIQDQLARYGQELANAQAAQGPRAGDAQRRLAALADQLTARWEGVREDRKQAFGVGGEGFHDYQSFRWQSLKRAGISKVLREVAKATRTARQESDRLLYGTDLNSPGALREASARSQWR